ncbi:MAG: hypothetical protein HKN44_03595 [Ilumatobacter sp.]|nr:hypothetical protein [Ilumatobacter sp.]
MDTTDEEVALLRSEVRELRAVIESMTGAVTSNTEGGPEPADAPPRKSRRALIATGAAAAAAVVTAPALGRPAAAADGDDMRIGVNNESEAGNTRLNCTGAGALVNRNILTVTDQADSSGFPAAIGAYSQGDRVTNGLYAFASSRAAQQNTGHAIVAAALSNARSHLYMQSGGADPRSDTYVHNRGEFRSTGGNLWFCVSSGTPGVWRKLAGTATSGSVHALAPRRVYDSRFTDGPLVDGGSRVISVKDAIDVETGAINQFNLVPSGATAVMFNLAVVNTVDVGFLSVTPGTATALTAASINWFGTGQILNNGTMSTVDGSRQLKVFGGGTADFVIDITGYTL